MRPVSILLLGAVLALAAPASAQCTGTEGVDFQRVTVDQINAIPQSNVDFLVANAATLTPEQITNNLTANPLVDTEATVEFTAVVLSDPYNSGNASINSATGAPNRIHLFMRDVAAATQGPEGMGIQIVDGRTDYSSTLGLFVGDEAIVCGVIDPFISSTNGSVNLQVSPISVQPTGNSYGPTDPLLAPVVTTIDDIHNVVNNLTQIDWARYAEFNGQYVRFEGIEVIQGVPAPTGRPNMLVGTPGQEAPQLSTNDISLRFRNDKGNYPNPPYNSRAASNPYTPPTAGIINLQGFLLYQGWDGGFGYSTPSRANWSINPFEDSDLEIASAPPIVTLNPIGIPSPSGGATISASVIPGTDGTTVTGVVANYTTSSGGSGEVVLTNTSGDLYTGTITGLFEGDFVSVTLTATDNTGASNTTRPVTRRVIEGPVASIFDIQNTPDGGAGPSALTTAEAVPFDLDAVVQSTLVSNSEYYVTLQDDEALGAFTGIWVSFGSDDPGLSVGDRVNISSARVVEDFDVTQLQDVTFTTTGSGDPYADKVVTTALFSDSDAAATLEQHEGIVLYFDDVTIVKTNADAPATPCGGGTTPCGEFAFSTEGMTGATLRADDLSNEIVFTGEDPDELLNEGDVHDFIRGPLFFSFGNFKLAPSSLDDIGEVITLATEGDLSTANVRIVGTYPNPAAGALRVRFEMATAGEVSLAVFDAMGRQVATVAEGAFGAAQHTVEADLGQLATGVYVLRLVTGGEVATTRIAIVR